jgi:diguanylate cyclase (GGDEF)-like protein
VLRSPQLYTWLEKQSPAFRTFVAYGIALLFSVIDYLTGYELSFSIFYLLPVSYVAWSIGKRPGVIISIFSASVSLASDVLAGETHSHPVIFLWNATARLGFFVTTSLLISHLNEVLARETDSATTDGLTGVANYRRFHAALNVELKRSQRYQRSFTLAYIDLDNFKTVNDQLGHSAGDFLLRTVALGIQSRIRSTDMVGRLGGDEFAILFPETSFEISHALLQNLRTNLLEAMHRNRCSVTFSIGAVTFDQSPASADDAIRVSDSVMYRAKNEGKNRVIVGRLPKSPQIIQVSTQQDVSK